jgi:hypothetical protein
MAQLKSLPRTDAHLLCLMEVWFDVSVPLVETLAEFNYSLFGNGCIGCPFCHAWLPPEGAQLVIGGFQRFDQTQDCPTRLAQEVLELMIER